VAGAGRGGDDPEAWTKSASTALVGFPPGPSRSKLGVDKPGGDVIIPMERAARRNAGTAATITVPTRAVDPCIGSGDRA
jgi:hypothetical protein